MATNENLIPIPGRLHSVATEGHVAGADEIYDDETGLTLDKVAGGALEEKEYTSGSDNGMGRVVLRKNLVNEVNTLTQSMINKSNTIYVIQYDFTLGENITIPVNCVLEFDGGSISGEYTITGNNTILDGTLKEVIGVSLHGTFDSSLQLSESMFKDMTEEEIHINSKKITNSIIAANVDGGWYNVGVAGSFISGKNSNIAHAEICGFNEETLTDYDSRDSVALYAETDGFAPTVLEGGIFTSKSVSFNNSINLREIKEGNYIDVFDTNENHYTSIVDSINLSTNTIYVKFNGFHNVSTHQIETPPSGSVVKINRITKLWGLNSNVVLVNNGNEVRAVTGCELGLNIRKSNIYSVGLDIVSLGTEDGQIALKASKFLVGFYSSSVKYMIQREYLVDETISYEDNANDYWIVEGRGLRSDGTTHHVARLDKDLNMTNNWAPISIKSRDSYIKVDGVNDKIITNKNICNTEGEVLLYNNPTKIDSSNNLELTLSDLTKTSQYYVEINGSAYTCILTVYCNGGNISGIKVTPVNVDENSFYVVRDTIIGYNNNKVYISRIGTTKRVVAIGTASPFEWTDVSQPTTIDNYTIWNTGDFQPDPATHVIPKGFQFFGTKPIWFNGTAWVDATGTPV